MCLFFRSIKDSTFWKIKVYFKIFILHLNNIFKCSNFCLWGISFTQVLFYLTATEVFYSLLIMPFVIHNWSHDEVCSKFHQYFSTHLGWYALLCIHWSFKSCFLFPDVADREVFYDSYNVGSGIAACHVTQTWSAALGDPSLQWRCCLMANQSCFEPGFYIFEPFCDEDPT